MAFKEFAAVSAILNGVRAGRQCLVKRGYVSPVCMSPRHDERTPSRWIIVRQPCGLLSLNLCTCIVQHGRQTKWCEIKEVVFRSAQLSRSQCAKARKTLHRKQKRSPYWRRHKPEFYRFEWWYFFGFAAVVGLSIRWSPFFFTLSGSVCFLSPFRLWKKKSYNRVCPKRVEL